MKPPVVHSLIEPAASEEAMLLKILLPAISQLAYLLATVRGLWGLLLPQEHVMRTLWLFILIEPNPVCELPLLHPPLYYFCRYYPVVVRLKHVKHPYEATLCETTEIGVCMLKID